jgi:hypothetical protein
MRNNRPALFWGRHFADGIIVLSVRWYLRFSLSYRDLKELMEVIHMIRKGQVRWLLKGDVMGQMLFIERTLGLKS